MFKNTSSVAVVLSHPYLKKKTLKNSTPYCIFKNIRKKTLKWTVSLILSETPCKEGNGRFTMLFLEVNVFFLGLKMLTFDNFANRKTTIELINKKTWTRCWILQEF